MLANGLLDRVDRISEFLFGLIMAVTIVGDRNRHRGTQRGPDDLEVYLAAVGIFLLVGRPSRRKLREEQVHRLTQIPPPQRYCQAIPTKSKLFPVRADTPLLA